MGKIAQRKLGSTRYVPLIQKLNPGVRPENLQVGQKLVLPTAAELANFQASLGSSTRRSNDTAVAASDVRKYTIARGDTLSEVAERMLGTTRRLADIQKLNPGINPASVRIGQVIYLPAR